MHVLSMFWAHPTNCSVKGRIFTNLFLNILFCFWCLCSWFQCITQGKSIFVADLNAVPTWRYPTACDPLSSLPVSLLCPTGFNLNDKLRELKTTPIYNKCINQKNREQKLQDNCYSKNSVYIFFLYFHSLFSTFFLIIRMMFTSETLL